MKFSKLIIALFLMAFFPKATAQKFELGKVSIKELQEKTHPIDTSAVATILYNKAKTVFEYNLKDGFSINTEYEFRIKIYKKEGLKWANKQVSYYVGYQKYNDDVVEFSNAVTYNLENEKIVKTKLNNEGIFKKNVNKNWSEASITMPNVKVGSIIEYKYILKTENIVEFPVFNFQYEIPVNYSEYNTEIPGFFVYKSKLLGFIQLDREQKITNGSLNYAKENEPTKSNIVTFQQVISKYKTYNIPALKEEAFVDNIQNYRTSMELELEKTQFYGEPVKDYAQTWEGVAKSIYNDKDFGDELLESGYFEQDYQKIINNVGSQNERMEAIFKFVQNKMNWDNKRGCFTDKGVKKAYQEGTGNIAEINFILITMLKAAGINANPVLISTIDNGILLFPSRAVFNYVIVAAEIDGKQILLDATNKYTTFNILPLNVLNRTGRLIRQDGTSDEISLDPKTQSKESTNMEVSLNGKAEIVGKIRIQKTDYEAFIFRENNSGINKENYLEKIENDLNGIQISDYSIENVTDLSKPIAENITFTSDKGCEIINGKMYINPLLFFTQTKNPFVQERREFPIYFGYPTQEKFSINIEIPQGYVVESYPKTIKIATIENTGLFAFDISVSGTKIQIQATTDIISARLSANYYRILKEFFQKVIDKQNEKIVLKKI
ncbi:MAG TPA: DUF3857 domain-containing protein [Flavobacterium sp.]|nr:DUF3857 domain-containing protein [Flavobacterium sp.]